MSTLGRIGVLTLAAYDHRTLLGIVRRAESLGYGTFWYADERLFHETYVGLAAAATATSKIRLGPAVTDPFSRHPGMTAMAIGSLDDLSGGRAVLGIGAGSMGFEQLGIRLHRPAIALREAVQVIRRLWAGERVTYEGEVITIRDARLEFTARPDIPIYIASNGQYGLRVAGALADAVVVAHCASPKILDQALEPVRFGRERSGRDAMPKVVARIDVAVSHDREAALYAAKVRLARFLWRRYPDIEYLPQHGLTLPRELDRRLRLAGPFPKSHDLSLFSPFADAIPDELVYPIAVAGTPVEVGRQIRAILATGADELMVYLIVPEGESIISTMELMAAGVQE